MRIESVELFTFEELSEEVQEKAIRNLWDINLHPGWWECIYEDAETVGVEIKGFDIDRGSYCEIEVYDFYETAELILRHHGKSCETYQAADDFIKKINVLYARNEMPVAVLHNLSYKGEELSEKEDQLWDYCEALLSDIEDEILQLESRFLAELEYAYLEALRADYEDRTSETMIKQSIIANEYEFTSEGDLW